MSRFKICETFSWGPVILFSKKNIQYLYWILLFIAVPLVFEGTAYAEPLSVRENPVREEADYSLLPHLNPKKLFLRSEIALIIDIAEGEVLFEKNSDTQQPIASITKLMTAMVVLDAGLPKKAVIQVTRADRDRLRGSGSRLSYGSKVTREDLLKITLVGSDNRAAAALGRTYPGGHKAAVRAMNKKAQEIGLKNTVFKGVSGLSSGNLSTASDLVLLVKAAYQYPFIRKVSTLKRDFVTDLRKGYKVEFMNTNRLLRSKQWDIELSKTGYIADSGHCLVMQTEIAGRPVIMVLLNSWGKLSKFGDSNRIRKWLIRADQKAKSAARLASANKHS